MARAADTALRGVQFLGPRLEKQAPAVRYTAAILVMLGIAFVRAALVPLVGTEAPLLPFVLGVILSAYLSGRGPALLACLLTPLLATLWFTQWPTGVHPWQWAAHVTFFVGIGVLVVTLMHEIQLAYRGQQLARDRIERAAQQARESAARMRLLTDHLPVLISYIDADEVFRFANAAYREWLGYDPSDPPTSLYQAFGEARYRERFPYIHAARRGELVRFEGTLPHHSLGPRLCEISYVPEREVGGGISGFYVMAQDITERRQAEEALRERERLLKLVYDNASDGLCLLAVEGAEQFRFASVNEGFLQISGYERARVQGRLLEEVVPRHNQAVTRAKCLEAMAARQALFYHEVADLPAGRRFAEITLIPIAEPASAVTHLLLAYRDVTVREQAQEQLREANRRKDEFLAMLAHELRNPLAPIRNVAQILSNSALDAATVRRSSELLQRQASQLTRLVDDLLDVARITRGAIELKKESLALERVLGTAIESVQPLLDLKHQTVSLRRSPEVVFVEADSVRLCQVLANLLTNASKYSPEGAEIHLAIECDSKDVLLSVRDRGMGIDPEMLPHIFELFLQGDRSLDRTQGGLGIGLTIAKHLIEMQGGRIEARSAGLGQGSEFRVQLPRLNHQDAPIPSSSAGECPRGSTQRILLVEDNPDSAESLAMLLKIAGHEVLIAHDGITALEQLEHFPAQFILLDIGLPGMDGYLVAQSIRTRFPTLGARLYALTGYGRTEDREQALAAGFDDHLTKPVDPQWLLQRLAGDRAAAGSPKPLPGT
jgi:PAS domain S-box-containing protein